MNSKELVEKFIADGQEHQKRIDKMWDEVDRRRRKVGIIILSTLAGVVGLFYYLTQ